MKKIILALGVILISLIRPMMSIAQEENLSPIETIEWGNNSSTSIEDTEINAQPNESETSLNQENSEDISTNQNVSNKILEIWNAIQTSSDFQASDYYAVHVIDDQIQVNARGMLRNDQTGEFTTQKAPLLPETYLIEMNGNQVVHQWISLDTMVNYVADAINMYPEQYANSPVEKFYIYAQEHLEELKGKYVEINSSDLNSEIEKYYLLNDFFKEVINKYLQQYPETLDQNAKEVESGVYEIVINGEFKNIMNSIAEENTSIQNIEEIKDLISEKLEGSIIVNTQINEIGISLLNEMNESEKYGIEYYIQVAQNDPLIPTQDLIVSQAQLTEMLGFDVITEINAYNQELNIDEMLPMEESHE